MKKRVGLLLGIIVYNFLTPLQLCAQQADTLSISSTIIAVQQNLPRLKSYREQINAREEQVKLARNTLMPDLTPATRQVMLRIIIFQG